MKSCAFCGNRIPSVTASGRRVKPSEHAQRVFCSRRCAGLAGPPPPPSKTGRVMPKRAPESASAAERLVGLLATYAPLPLTAEDAADELSVSKSTVQRAATTLVRDGRITRERFDGAALYRVAPEGVRA